MKIGIICAGDEELSPFLPLIKDCKTSVMDMEVKSLKKKFKDKRFAAGCSREIITKGAEQLGWSLEELMEKTILAMRSCEENINCELDNLGL